MELDLQTLMEAARAEGAAVEVITVRIDFGGERPASEAASVSPLPSPKTDLEAAERASAPMRLDEWASVLPGISAAELNRAAKAEALAVRRKGEGSDHNALVADPAEVVAYVSQCEQVQAGELPPPQWWNSVRKQGNAVIERGYAGREAG